MFGAFTSTKPVRLDVYNTNGKQIVVPHDSTFGHAVNQNSLYVGKQPPTYLTFAIVVAFVNPLLAPMAFLFSYMSIRAYRQGDLMYAEKWSQYAFLACLMILLASLIIYVVLFFGVSTITYRGGHSY